MEALGFDGPQWILYVILGLVAAIALLSSNTSRVLLSLAAIVAVPVLGVFGVLHGSALIVGVTAVAIVCAFCYVLVKLPRNINITNNTYVSGDGNYTNSNTSYTNWKEVKGK